MHEMALRVPFSIIFYREKALCDRHFFNCVNNPAWLPCNGHLRRRGHARNSRAGFAGASD